ncbi:hypothetical protein RFI_25204, partial [Reticulomyxa filosa]
MMQASFKSIQLCKINKYLMEELPLKLKRIQHKSPRNYYYLIDVQVEMDVHYMKFVLQISKLLLLTLLLIGNNDSDCVNRILIMPPKNKYKFVEKLESVEMPTSKGEVETPSLWHIGFKYLILVSNVLFKKFVSFCELSFLFFKKK